MNPWTIIILANFQRAKEEGSEGKSFFIEKCHLINIGGVIKLENHHFATKILGIDSGINLQWMLKPLGLRLLRSRIVAWSQHMTSEISYEL